VSVHREEIFQRILRVDAEQPESAEVSKVD
jgi:sRNA-binding carbon storage regulator CsrA